MFRRLCILIVFALAAPPRVASFPSTIRPVRALRPVQFTTSTAPYSSSVSRLFANRRALSRRSSFPGDANKSDSRLTLTNAIVAINIAVYLLCQLIPGLDRRLMKVDFLIRRGQVYRLATALFVHGNLPHLMFNSYSVYNTGASAEKMFGKTRFLIIYFLSGILANVGTFMCKSSPYSMGASGSAFGLIGAFGMFFYRNKRILGSRADSGLESIKSTVFINLLYSLRGSNIDNMAHVFGFLAGALVSYGIGPNLKVVDTGYGGRRVVDRPLIAYSSIIKSLTDLIPRMPAPKKESMTWTDRKAEEYRSRNDR